MNGKTAMKELYAPIQDDGIKVATIERSPLELRIRWREYRGHKFLDLRLWQEFAGGWKPLKKDIVKKFV